MYFADGLGSADVGVPHVAKTGANFLSAATQKLTCLR